MSNVSAEMLKEAFIDPIRFALLLDDDFPTYTQMTAQGASQAFDYKRAGELFTFCRQKGWLCDVDNAAAVTEKFEREKHLNQSDLLVLDFHLEPTKKDDPSKALSILQELARSEHFNLVIIYTGADPVQVVREVSFSLGGGNELSQQDFKDAEVFFEDLDQAVLDDVMQSCNLATIENYLSGRRPNGSSVDLRAALLRAGANVRTHNVLIDYVCAEHFIKTIPESVIHSRLGFRKVEASFTQGNETKWVSQGNLFAVVVHKSENPNVLVERLHSALVEWNPSPLRVLMIHARASLEKAGTVADEKVLDTPRRQAGWLLRILLAKDDAEGRRYIQELYGRLFERLIHSVEGGMIDFGMRLIVRGDLDPVDAAKLMAAAPAAMSNDNIYHALNEHLCSDLNKDMVMTTGVIFRADRNGADSYWLCVSPACDLVPGQNVGGWDGDLHPIRPISAVRLSPVKNSQAIALRLKEATQGRHVFVHIDNVPVALEVADSNSRQMKIETILIANEGVIDDSRFDGFTIGCLDRGPVVQSIVFEVVAVLRADYANRLLAESGYQRSRIGIDFVNLP
ncbi:hypothetical protein PS685_00523 [Pseudomonas fluorescens]|uniref:Response receiver domain-containing protein n=1 Tax=Pseudomonas fluorescens TaxID=294 RepID=A0A5E6YEE2_PSEFL|nr:response regulator receiver domain [Pseudomonas fluorescens]VVN51059.1 hypothetical protein PS685_00523 [Pseudomonas fluorescens]